MPEPWEEGRMSTIVIPDPSSISEVEFHAVPEVHGQWGEARFKRLLTTATPLPPSKAREPFAYSFYGWAKFAVAGRRYQVDLYWPECRGVLMTPEGEAGLFSFRMERPEGQDRP
jgi:hypothetical protein